MESPTLPGLSQRGRIQRTSREGEGEGGKGAGTGKVEERQRQAAERPLQMAIARSHQCPEGHQIWEGCAERSPGLNCRQKTPMIFE